EELEKIIQQMSKAAKADQELADITFQRDTELRQKKVISQHDLDVAKAEKRRADAIYRAYRFGQVLTRFLTQMSRSALDYEDSRQTRLENHHFKLSSAADGKILKLADKSARVVRMGTVLMEIGDIEHIEVETEVLSTLAVKLKPGMPAEILRWGGEQALPAEIKHIEPYGFTKISALGVEEQRVKVILDIKTEYSARQQLGHGYRVESRFILWRSDKVLQIPNSALFRDNKTDTNSAIEQWAVYIIKDNKLQKRTLKIGQRNNLTAEVVDGLDEGEHLVSYLSNELKDGVKIEIRQ
ncbi:MAG: HlyD family efflux transporter periplasmic adaptor subunit, partial [Methyloprofundus sp.]|nr:HlyD family efflux transporter periplasmic adaptor subunit [Methyloprofundus sp.]